MKQAPEKMVDRPTPVSSPYPALQALLPRLASITTNSDNRRIFDKPAEVEEYLADQDDENLHVVPVWAIKHTDLTSSQVVKWTYKRWLN